MLTRFYFRSVRPHETVARARRSPLRGAELAKLLMCAAVAAGALWGAGPRFEPTPAHAATCTPVASPSADVSPSGTFDTPTNIIATFDNARQAEGCSVPLSINATTFGSSSPQQQMLMLFNAERQDRGLPTLQLDSSLMSQIDLNHSREMAQYSYFNHPSPVNQPGPSNVFERDWVNPAISGHYSYLGEDIAAGYSTAAAAVFAYMYQDSGSSWGHRHNILGYTGTSFGTYNWVGIGVASGGTYGTYYSSDFLQGLYTPPAATDTQSPSLTPPTITSGTVGGTVSVQATNVQDTGASSGAAGVTDVVFYASSITMDGSGNANTVVATQSSAGVWTASLSLPSGATLHAVAVDGSGNFRDCAASATSCGSTSPTATPTSTPTTAPTSTSTPTPTPTATSTSGGTSSGALITNGGFESGQSPWSESASNGHQLVATTRAHTGSYSASFCGYNSCNDQLWQSFTVPTSYTSLTLTYWYFISTQETSSYCYDAFHSRIRTTTGTTISSIQDLCNQNTGGWVQKSVDLSTALSAYKGQQVQLYFQGTDDSVNPTSYFIDDVSLTKS